MYLLALLARQRAGHDGSIMKLSAWKLSIILCATAATIDAMPSLARFKAIKGGSVNSVWTEPGGILRNSRADWRPLAQYSRLHCIALLHGHDDDNYLRTRQLLTLILSYLSLPHRQSRLPPHLRAIRSEICTDGIWALLCYASPWKDAATEVVGCTSHERLPVACYTLRRFITATSC